jgi:hypothetical protein
LDSDFIYRKYNSSLRRYMVTNNAINNSVKVTKYIANDTWTKDPRTNVVEVHIFGGGAGGGSGRQGASTAAGGGAGGGSGGYTTAIIPAIQLGSPLTVTVGGTANGGGAQSSANTDGNAGTIGNDSSFGTLLVAKGGAVGAAGTNGTSTGGAGGSALIPGNAGGNGALEVGIASAAALVNMVDSTHNYSSGGGGGGGGDSGTERTGGAGGNLSLGNPAIATVYAGGTAGLESTTINGGNGTSVPVPSNFIITGATGGGGGGGQKSGAAAGNGGNGGTPSGGGGGGGGSLNGTNSGTGGQGARGEIWVIEYFG